MVIHLEWKWWWGGVPKGMSLPATWNNGDFFYDVDDNALYVYQQVCRSLALNMPWLLQNTDANTSNDGFILNTNGCALLNTAHVVT